MTLCNQIKNERRRSHEPFQIRSTKHFPLVSSTTYRRCPNEKRLDNFGQNQDRNEYVHQYDFNHLNLQHISLLNIVPPSKICQN